MSTRFFATSARMPHPLGKLIIIMFYFIVGGFHLGLFLRQVSMRLAIGLTFGIFMLNNGRFHGPCEYFFCELPMTSLFFCPFKIVRCQFSLKFHLQSISLSIVTFQIFLMFFFFLFVKA